MIDAKQLKARCEMNWEDFPGHPWYVDKPTYRRYRFVDNGSDILAIAHLDYVGPNKSFGLMEHGGKHKAFHGGMDDRAGAYIILDLLLSLLGDKPYDILLTDGEETHASTAGIFTPPKGRKYKWMFEFDREGVDAVMYDYGSDKWDKTLKNYGWSPHRGTGSDICYLYDLGCIGFNFGNGNHEGHTAWNHVDLMEMESSVKWFVKFYGDYKNKALPFNEKTNRRKDEAVVVQSYMGGEWGRGDFSKVYWYDNDWHQYAKGDKRNKKGGRKNLGYKPDYVFDFCEECGLCDELDPETFLCLQCSKKVELEGVYRSTYKWRNT